MTGKETIINKGSPSPGRVRKGYIGNGQVGWNHNPRFRNGVPHTNRDVANRFNGGRRGSMRPPTQLPANVGSIKPSGSLGGANRVGNIGSNGLGGRGGASQLPAHGLAGRGGASQLPAPPGSVGSANRMAPGGGFGGRQFGNRGFHGFGGGGCRGGGRRRKDPIESTDDDEFECSAAKMAAHGIRPAFPWAAIVFSLDHADAPNAAVHC